MTPDASADAAPPDASADHDASADAPADAPADAAACTGTPCTPIKHVVVIVQENHTFDSYFANWCKAAPGSAPKCTSGPTCCETGPAKDPGGNTTPEVLDDTTNAAFDPNHHQACELSEIDGGKMDVFVTNKTCGDKRNFAYADSTVQAYWTLAAQGALADHYFQPNAGESSQNDMYFARTRFVFLDDLYAPQGAIGSKCGIDFIDPQKQYTDETIADLLDSAGVAWAFYSEGYANMATAVMAGNCAAPAADCHYPKATNYDCFYDPTDNPFAYYKGLVDNPKYFKDYADLATDLSAGKLPAVAFVKALPYKTEHPGYTNTISAGIAFVQGVLAAIAGSSAASSTLVLLTYDEGGGFFDHVAPPATSTVDNEPYGTRVPTIAIGPFARAGSISHVVMEHSSIVKFIEYNWLKGKTGELAGRDAQVANIGSLLDPKLGVPEN
jgi:phospholipase C